jgi:thiosulfate/3-mercaptopyruvate sulfurtransferase
MPVSLIEPAQLSRLMSSLLPVIVDARPHEEFAVEHIPGAVSIHWDDWCDKAPEYLDDCLQQPGYWGVLTSAQNCLIESQLSRLGLSNDRPIIVYADGPFSKGREGRIAWMLAYWGAADVRLLNGGLSAWKNAGLETSAGSNRQNHDGPVGTFKISLQAERRVQLPALVKDARFGRMPVMLDTRTRKEFVGLDYRYMPRMGSVPDSLLLSHSSIFANDGRYLARDAYLKAMPDKVLNTSEAVAFCEVGVRACNVSLLFEIYTGHVMPVYDGSMMEWSADLSLPVRTLTA